LPWERYLVRNKSGRLVSSTRQFIRDEQQNCRSYQCRRNSETILDGPPSTSPRSRPWFIYLLRIKGTPQLKQISLGNRRFSIFPTFTRRQSRNPSRLGIAKVSRVGLKRNSDLIHIQVLHWKRLPVCV
jgi:hypothetical protein